ncbi:hypothetical protein HZ326_19143 [Fusarium oxysporum f. sp. albedinis]|nr:hypothetical protein HZ326_19143 [Fusarium oxysporum f. sp. albedinis]
MPPDQSQDGHMSKPNTAAQLYLPDLLCCWSHSLVTTFPKSQYHSFPCRKLTRPTQLTCSYRLVILPIPRHFAPNPRYLHAIPHNIRIPHDSRPHVLNSLHLSLLVSGNCSVSRDIHVCLAMRRMAEPILLSLSAPALLVDSSHTNSIPPLSQTTSLHVLLNTNNRLGLTIDVNL